MRTPAAGRREFPRAYPRLVSFLVSFPLLASLSGCSAANPTDPSNFVSSSAEFQLNPQSITLYAGDTLRIRASGAAGSVEWSSSDPAIATVDSRGLVTAKLGGNASIKGSSGKGQGTTKVNVRNPKNGLNVSPKTATLSRIPDTLQLTAYIYPNRTVEGAVWTSLNPEIASVDNFGRVISRAAGVALIAVVAVGDADTTTIYVESNVVSAPSTPAPPPPTAAGTIPLDVVRLTGGSGTALVSSGIPLREGALMPGASSSVRILLNGVEQPAYVEALAGRYRDGSVRSVLVQFQTEVGSAPLPATLEIGSSRTKLRSKSPVSFSYPDRPVPQAIAVPQSREYLVETGIVGSTVLAPSFFSSEYEQKFVSQSDLRWEYLQSIWGTDQVGTGNTLNYYDRAHTYWAWWVRTGNPEYWKRAAYYLIAWREVYMRPNNCTVQPHNMQIEGMALHYLLTGDEPSRTCVGQMGDMLSSETGWPIGSIGAATKTWLEGRIQSRVLQAHLSAWQIAAPTARGVNWAAQARKDVSSILETQNANGSFSLPGSGGGQINYMTGLVYEVMAKYYNQFEADPRIVESAKQAVGYLWNTQWVPSAGAFQYSDNADRGTNPADDVNMLFVYAFGWLYQQTGDATYRDRGDTIFQEGVTRTWFGSNAQQADKQYNQQYRASYVYLADRR